MGPCLGNTSRARTHVRQHTLQRVTSEYPCCSTQWFRRVDSNHRKRNQNPTITPPSSNETDDARASIPRVYQAPLYRLPPSIGTAAWNRAIGEVCGGWRFASREVANLRDRKKL